MLEIGMWNTGLLSSKYIVKLPWVHTKCQATVRLAPGTAEHRITNVKRTSDFDARICFL